MSERLAISASFSVLAMAAFALFSGLATRVPLGPEAVAAPAAVSAAEPLAQGPGSDDAQA